MSCAQSPEDGYHRFKLAPHGLEFATVCTYCGAEKTLRPFDDEDGIPLYRRHAADRPSAARVLRVLR